MTDPRKNTESRRKVLKLIGGTSLLVPLVAMTGCSGEKTPPAPAAAPGKKPAAGSKPEMVVKPVTETAPEKPAAGDASARLSEDNPQAKSLGYVHDATAVDASRQPRYEAGQLCSNCALYQGGDEWGGCSIFPGRQVNANGWCNVYAPKPG